MLAKVKNATRQDWYILLYRTTPKKRETKTLCSSFQVLSLVEQEKSTLQERLAQANRDFSNATLEYERLKRDALAHQEQDKNTINELQNELKNFRKQFDEAV